MNQLAVREEINFDIILKDVETMQRMCKELMKAKHYQKMGEDGIFAIIQASKSLGINPLEGLNGALYYVQGKVGMGSETMNALIRRRGHSITKDPKSDNSICILHGKRADNGDSWTVRFSLEDAKRAGLLKNMYDKYPGVMLYNRAMSMLARQLFPDIIHNAGYNIDELKEISDSKSSFDNMKTAEVLGNPEEFISDEQKIALLSVLEECDIETQTNFLSFISRAPVNAESLDKIPVSQFERLFSLIKKKRDSMKSKESEIKIEEEQVIEDAN